MRKSLIALLLLTVCTAVAVAQQPMAARANIEAYYDEAAIEKLNYRESPYYRELTGSWRQRQTDSSIFYARQIDAEKSWRDYRVYLNVRCGRAVRVLLNNKVIGYGDDSRHWNEFLLDAGLRYGKENTLVIEAMKHSRGAMLEDTTLQVGLNGTPYLLFKNDPNISDLSLVADYDAAGHTGTLTLTASVFCGKRKGKYYVEVELWDTKGHELDRMGKWVVFNGKDEELVDITRSWPEVEPWSAEHPALYTAVVRLRDEKMEEEELVGGRFGFRRVEVKDGLLTVNGSAITLKGVTYGIEHTEGYTARENMKRDIAAMKRNNINAVHTSRYSPMDPVFYELCDQYGLYVVCDANLLPLSEQHHAVATDQDFIPMFQQRVEHLYGKYKNHPSIIAWSLGNTRDNGVCMTAAYKWLKGLDKTRPVIFSGADHGESTDVIAPRYPEVQSLKQTLSKQGGRPCLMLAAVDQSRFAQLAELWKLVGERRQLQGGFVDKWPLPQAMLVELKHLYRPFEVRLSKMSPDEGEFLVTNRNDFANFSQYTLEYNIYTNLQSSITGGDLPVAIRPGESEKVSMRIPSLDMQGGEEAFIRFDLKQRHGTRRQWQTGEGQPVATEVFPLPSRKEWKQLMLNDGEPFSPDDTAALPVLPQLLFVGHPDWQPEVVDRRDRRPDERTRCCDYMIRYTDAAGATVCDVRATHTLFSTGDATVDYQLAPADRVRGHMQPMVRLQCEGDSVAWYGLDREVFFAEGNSGIVGVYRRPRTAFARGQVRWCVVGGLYMRLTGQPCTMTVTDESVSLTPQPCRSFRVHLRALGNENPHHLLSVDYPEMASGMLEPPAIKVSEARFAAPLKVSLVPQQAPQDTRIHYTLDGSEPTDASPLYTQPFELTATTVVKARAYAKEMPPSFVAVRKFNYDYILKTLFSRKPNTPYNTGADTILFDGERGSADDLSRGWLGFSGPAVTTVVELSKPVDVEYVTLRYAHSPSAWIFAPRKVSVLVAQEGASYTDTLEVSTPFDPADQGRNTPQVVEIRVPVEKNGVQTLKIIPRTIGTIPSWHRAKGLNPWMLVDEIEVVEKMKND